MLRAIDRVARDEKQRDALTRNPDALDPITAEALVTTPESLTGISKMHRQQLMARALQAQHGDKNAELKELERAIRLPSRRWNAGREEIRLKSAVFDPHKFNELAAPAEAKANASWLRKRLGEIKVVDSERSVERPATPEEIETGVYAKNFDDNAR
jgi:hypothetical protein